MSLCVINEPESMPKDEQFMAEFEQKVKSTIDDYELIKPGKLLVAISGGKDSTVLLYVLKKLGYDVEAITVDVHIGCYTKENLQRVTTFCEQLGVKLHIKSFKGEFGHSVCYMTETLKQGGKALGSCTVCGVLRRTVINRLAREVKGTQITTGHNLDDEVQTILMNVLQNKMHLSARLGPKPKSEGFIQRVKPLYFMPEADITKYSKMQAFNVYYGHCPCSLGSTRNKVKNTLTPEQKQNIMKWFKKVLPKLQEKFKGKFTLKSCEKCGEPSSRLICRACDIIDQVKQSEKLIAL